MCFVQFISMHCCLGREDSWHDQLMNFRQNAEICDDRDVSGGDFDTNSDGTVCACFTNKSFVLNGWLTQPENLGPDIGQGSLYKTTTAPFPSVNLG